MIIYTKYSLDNELIVAFIVSTFPYIIIHMHTHAHTHTHFFLLTLHYN